MLTYPQKTGREKQFLCIQQTHAPPKRSFSSLILISEWINTRRGVGAAGRKMLLCNVCNTRKLQVRRRGRWFRERHP